MVSLGANFGALHYAVSYELLWAQKRLLQDLSSFEIALDALPLHRYCVCMKTIDPIEQLARIVKRCGSKIAAARELEISRNYLNDILEGTRKPGPKGSNGWAKAVAPIANTVTRDQISELPTERDAETMRTSPG